MQYRLLITSKYIFNILFSIEVIDNKVVFTWNKFLKYHKSFQGSNNIQKLEIINPFLNHIYKLFKTNSEKETCFFIISKRTIKIHDLYDDENLILNFICPINTNSYKTDEFITDLVLLIKAYYSNVNNLTNTKSDINLFHRISRLNTFSVKFYPIGLTTTKQTNKNAAEYSYSAYLTKESLFILPYKVSKFIFITYL